MSKKKMSSSAVALLGAAALSGLLTGTASASSDLGNSRLLLSSNTQSGTYAADAAAGSAADAAATDKHACKGKNSCKGKGGCNTGDNGCKAKNSCKGKGGCNTMPAAPADPHASPAAH